jgi:hypothetical protein
VAADRNLEKNICAGINVHFDPHTGTLAGHSAFV